MFLNYLCFTLVMLNIHDKDILWQETFDYPNGKLPEIFWSEGCEAVIQNGRLFVDADTAGYRCSSVWFDKEFSGNISVEFDAHIVSSSDTANNVNFFFMYSDPSGQHLRQSAHKRESGLYRLYHDLNGYIFTNVTNGNVEVRYRLRDNPGFKLVSETFTGENRAGETHHIKIVKINDRFQYWVDGKNILDVVDDKHNPVHERGLMGLRTWHTSLWIDNLLVKRIVE